MVRVRRIGKLSFLAGWGEGMVSKHLLAEISGNVYHAHNLKVKTIFE
jgi:hypothetical protein